MREDRASAAHDPVAPDARRRSLSGRSGLVTNECGERAKVAGWRGIDENAQEHRTPLGDNVTLADDEGLFHIEAPPPVSLHDRFGMPPFSVLDRRSGAWQDRKRKWLSLGIRSELGRDGGLIYDPEASGMGQGIQPIEKRSDRTLQAMVANSADGSDYARKAQEELDRRVASGRRVLDGAPPPGGGGTGAWKGRNSDGAMRAIDPKWDSAAQGGTPRQLIPGAGGVGGAYDRSRPEGTLNTGGGRPHRGTPPNAPGAAPPMDGRRSGGPFSTAEENAARQRNAITGQETLTGTSIFDPVLCELAYRWFSAPGMSVLDPFAGGSVRGITAALLHRRYMGVDLRDIQVRANRDQGREILTRGEPMPRWVAGDSNEVLATAPREAFDLILSCPPYADLEVYSDDPRDISGMEYPEFCRVHREIISKAAEALKPDRFAAWVISDVRDKKGFYRGLVAETIQAFEAAGLRLYNEAIILDPVGSAAVRAGRIFLGGRKLTRMHQHLLVFTKGDWKRATLAVSPQEIVLEVPSTSEDGR
jgi:hypothetical protein